MGRHYGTYSRLNVHVGTSNFAVIRSLWRKLNPEIRHDKKFRRRRKLLYRAILREHKAARDLFRRYGF